MLLGAWIDLCKVLVYEESSISDKHDARQSLCLLYTSGERESPAQNSQQEQVLEDSIASLLAGHLQLDTVSL